MITVETSRIESTSRVVRGCLFALKIAALFAKKKTICSHLFFFANIEMKLSAVSPQLLPILNEGSGEGKPNELMNHLLFHLPPGNYRPWNIENSSRKTPRETQTWGKKFHSFCVGYGFCCKVNGGAKCGGGKLSHFFRLNYGGIFRSKLDRGRCVYCSVH